jgi:hypothetical protein
MDLFHTRLRPALSISPVRSGRVLVAERRSLWRLRVAARKRTKTREGLGVEMEMVVKGKVAEQRGRGLRA